MVAYSIDLKKLWDELDARDLIQPVLDNIEVKFSGLNTPIASQRETMAKARSWPVHVSFRLHENTQNGAEVSIAIANKDQDGNPSENSCLSLIETIVKDAIVAGITRHYGEDKVRLNLGDGKAGISDVYTVSAPKAHVEEMLESTMRELGALQYIPPERSGFTKFSDGIRTQHISYKKPSSAGAATGAVLNDQQRNDLVNDVEMMIRGDLKNQDRAPHLAQDIVEIVLNKLSKKPAPAASPGKRSF